jgi:isoleucyl-tRNA synthetase
LNDAYWRTTMDVKEAVNGALEKARNEKRIGASLGANVTLYAADELKASLERLGDELRFVMITSNADVKALSEEGGDATELDGLRVSVTASDAAKCERCWHHSDTVGLSAQHPALCGRCIENVEGDGEVRHFA